MDLRRLRTFVAVAEHGTISRAAQVLRITQPALSRQVASLEAEFGFALFERVGRRLVLTARGEQLLDDCRSLLIHAGTLGERAKALRRGDIRVLRVAASALTIEGAFPHFLDRYEDAMPGVRLALVEEDQPAAQLALLERGEVHLSVNVINIVSPDEARFGRYLLPRFQVVAASAPSMRLGRGGTVDIRRLAEQPLLLPNPSFATRNIFDAACRLAGVRPQVALESRAAHALLALAEAGHGVAIVPSILPLDRHAVSPARVTHRRAPLSIALAVLWDRRRTLPHYAAHFGELLAAHIRETRPHARPARDTARAPGRRRRAAMLV